MEKSVMRIIAAAIACLFVASCSAATPYAMVDGATVITTEKTMADHVISLASGKDCSLVRLEQGTTYCEEDEVVPHPNLFCYRELAGVTCYDRPDLRRGESGRVGENDHNYIKKY
jgi:hypothetical protein